VIPVRYYLVIVRGIVLKGAGVADLVPQIVAMSIIGVVLITLSIVRFKKTVA